MFTLHDKTRRALCLAGFFLFGVIPTFVVATWCVVRNLPLSNQAIVKELGHELGLEVKLEKIQHVRPGSFVLVGLELADPETHQMAFRCKALNATWEKGADPKGADKPLLRLEVLQGEIEVMGFRSLGRTLQTALQRTAGPQDADVMLQASTLILQAGENSLTLADLSGNMRYVREGAEAKVKFRMAGETEAEPAEIRFVRDRQKPVPVSGFEIITGGNSLPCSLLAAGLPELGNLGPQARFRGHLWGTQQGNDLRRDDWEGGMANAQWMNLDLEQIVSEHFPHKLSGMANMTLQWARFKKSRLTEANATLVAGPGVVDRGLLQAFAEERLAVDMIDLSALNQAFPYDQMAFDLSLDDKGMVLRGRCAAKEPGVMVMSHQQGILKEPHAQPMPIISLIQALAPQNAMQVPVTAQTDWLIRHLTLPKGSETSAEREASLPSSKVRLRDPNAIR